MGDQLESWRFGATLAENGVETCERFAADPDGFDDIRYPNAICSPIGQRPLDATDTGDVLTPSFKELEDLLKAAMARGDPTLDAYCQNYLLEERVSRGPQADYEGEESDWPDRIRDRFGPVLTNDRYRDVSNLPRKVSC